MTEQKSSLRESKSARWVVLILVSFTMMCMYIKPFQYTEYHHYHHYNHGDNVHPEKFICFKRKEFFNSHIEEMSGHILKVTK